LRRLEIGAFALIGNMREGMIMPEGKRSLAITIDFEDYRRQELRDHLGEAAPPNPIEVERQLDTLLALLEGLDARATFFSVGRLTGEVDRWVWTRIGARHRIGCHGHEHLRVNVIGRERFQQDLYRAKAALEDVSGMPVLSFRAPYFASDGTDPWFGEVLASAGIRIDSSRRIASPPAGFSGSYALEGSDGRVLEVPFASIGYGPKRLSVIGGTYFRLLPLAAIRRLLAGAEKHGFLPMIYMHPYDIDPVAPPLAYPRWGYARQKLGDWVRRRGRASVTAKLRALAESYALKSVEAVLLGGA
jgi:peptidoglycan/xylan/chitin deacetylase (PgdA/CDA1 family)